MHNMELKKIYSIYIESLDRESIYDGFTLLKSLKEHFTIGDKNSWWWDNFLSRKATITESKSIDSNVIYNDHTGNTKEYIESKSKKHKKTVASHTAKTTKNPTKNNPIASGVYYVIDTILAQNTKYDNAFKGIKTLYEFLYIRLDSMHSGKAQYSDLFSSCAYPNLALISTEDFENDILEILSKEDTSIIANAIKDAGLYNQKAERIKLFCKNILNDFGNFATFSTDVSKEWVLSQKGIGNESASCILNYALKREEMVVDSYTQRLLHYIGYDYESYEDIQRFLITNLEKAKTLYSFDISLAQIMARLHGKIVKLNKIVKLKKQG